ncbi:MAG: winged helix-turn-helix transcriptional regulator [Deltaproteobacteria bacterium]|nr:winged helix-turn-helix transcriptional regulator [Deltaproteobacteria bacterium]
MPTDAAARLAALDDVMAALAHAARRHILLTIHFWGGSMTAGEIAGRFGHSWPTTTRHLRVLEDAGLVQHQREGRLRRYELLRERLGLVHEWLAWFSPRPAEAAAPPAATGTAPPLAARTRRRR